MDLFDPEDRFTPAADREGALCVSTQLDTSCARSASTTAQINDAAHVSACGAARPFAAHTTSDFVTPAMLNGLRALDDAHERRVRAADASDEVRR